MFILGKSRLYPIFFEEESSGSAVEELAEKQLENIKETEIRDEISERNYVNSRIESLQTDIWEVKSTLTSLETTLNSLVPKVEKEAESPITESSKVVGTTLPAVEAVAESPVTEIPVAEKKLEENVEHGTKSMRKWGLW